jgi:hypothetical protein
LKSILNFTYKHFLNIQTTEDGANTILYTALSPELEGVGGVYINTQEIAKHHRQAYDVDLQKRLWERSKELCQ